MTDHNDDGNGGPDDDDAFDFDVAGGRSDADAGAENPMAEMLKQLKEQGGGGQIVAIGPDGQPIDLAELFGAEARPGPMLVNARHVHDHITMAVTEVLYQVEIPARVSEENVSVEIDTENNMVRVKASREELPKPAGDFCHDDHIDIKGEHQADLPALMRYTGMLQPGRLKEEAVDVNIDMDQSLVTVKIKSTPEMIEDQKTAIAEIRKRQSGMMAGRMM